MHHLTKLLEALFGKRLFGRNGTVQFPSKRKSNAIHAPACSVLPANKKKPISRSVQNRAQVRVELRRLLSEGFSEHIRSYWQSWLETMVAPTRFVTQKLPVQKWRPSRGQHSYQRRFGYERLETRRLLTTTLFFDNFESGTVSTSNWPNDLITNVVRPIAAAEMSYTGPSRPADFYAASFSGSRAARQNGSVGMQSRAIDLMGFKSATLNYVIEEGGKERENRTHKYLGRSSSKKMVPRILSRRLCLVTA